MALPHKILDQKRALKPPLTIQIAGGDVDAHCFSKSILSGAISDTICPIWHCLIKFSIKCAVSRPMFASQTWKRYAKWFLARHGNTAQVMPSLKRLGRATRA